MDEVKAPPGDDSWLTTGRVFLLLSLLAFLTFPSVVLGTQTFIFRDYGLFSYPVAFFQRQCFWRGELPLWNPYSQCGLPFLAQWNTMCLYPPALLYLLLPLTWALSFFCVAHLVWGGLGMYLLARQWTGNRLAGALAGVIFAFNGLNLNFMMWPSHVATFSWLPWVWWLLPQAWREGGVKLAWATLAASLQMLAGGPETILFTWVMVFLLFCGDWLSYRLGRGLLQEVDPARASFRSAGVLGNNMPLRFLAIVLLVALICAAQLLPFLELLMHSQRDRGYGSSAHDWSMPFWGWANFLVPLFRTGPTSQGVYLQNGQYWTSSYYAGIGTVLLAIVAVWRARSWRVRLLAVLVLVGLVLAWGDTSVLFCALRSCVPGLGLVRYPVKFVILVLASVPLLAAFGVAALASRAGKVGRFEWTCTIVVLLLVGGIIALERNDSVQTWRVLWHNALARAGFLVLIVVLAGPALSARSQRRPFRPVWHLLLLLVFWFDFRTHVPNQNPTVSPAVYAPTLVRAQWRWSPEPRLGESRAMVSAAARAILSQNPLENPEQNYIRNRLAARGDANLLDELPQIDGFFSLIPKQANAVVSFLYTKPGYDFSKLLDFLAVSQVTSGSQPSEWEPRPSAMPLVTAGQRPVFSDEISTLAALSNTNVDFRRTVFLPAEAWGAIDATDRPAAHVRIMSFDSKKVSVKIQTSGPAMVVCSQSYYPGWRAYVDGRQTRLWRANYAFQAVEVPSGRHHVDLVYKDRTFLAGVALSLLGMVVWVWLLARARFRGGLAQASEVHHTSDWLVPK